MTRFALAAFPVLLVLSAGSALAGLPRMKTYRLSHTAEEGWSFRLSPAKVPSWDPRYEALVERFPQQRIKIKVRGRKWRDYLYDVQSLQVKDPETKAWLRVGLSSQATLTDPGAVYLEDPIGFANQPRDLFLLHPGQRVEALGEGEYVKVRVRGVRGGITAYVAGCRLKRSVVFDPAPPTPVPFDTRPHPGVTLLSELLRAQTHHGTATSFRDGELQRMASIGPRNRADVYGYLTQRPDLAWVRVGGQPGEELWTFCPVEDLETLWGGGKPLEEALAKAPTQGASEAKAGVLGALEGK